MKRKGSCLKAKITWGTVKRTRKQDDPNGVNYIEAEWTAAMEKENVDTQKKNTTTDE